MIFSNVFFVTGLPFENDTILLSASLTTKQPLFQANKLAYYSIHGSNILWKFPKQKALCEIHTTTDTEFTNKKLFVKKVYKGELLFNVRSYGPIQIELLTTPISYTFRILIKIGNKASETLLILEDYNKETIELGRSNVLNTLNYWKWNEFSLSIDYDTLTLNWMGESGYLFICLKYHIDAGCISTYPTYFNFN